MSGRRMHPHHAASMEPNQTHWLLWVRAIHEASTKCIQRTVNQKQPGGILRPRPVVTDVVYPKIIVGANKKAGLAVAPACVDDEYEGDEAEERRIDTGFRNCGNGIVPDAIEFNGVVDEEWIVRP